MGDVHDDDDQRRALIRATLNSAGWGLLHAEMRRVEESEDREMWAIDCPDDRRFQLAAIRYGRRHAMEWFQKQLDRKA